MHHTDYIVTVPDYIVLVTVPDYKVTVPDYIPAKTEMHLSSQPAAHGTHMRPSTGTLIHSHVEGASALPGPRNGEARLDLFAAHHSASSCATLSHQLLSVSSGITGRDSGSDSLSDSLLVLRRLTVTSLCLKMARRMLTASASSRARKR